MAPSHGWALAPWLLAAAAFALAFFQPVEYVDSDPGIALLVAQSVLDHHTWSLDAYLDDPACAYDLETDYRIRRRDGSYFYYSYGVPLVSLPWVWLANRAGYHMLDQGDEFALQNLLSALCCALLGVLLYHICRAFIDPPSSLAIAAITLFGSSLISTLATGLWNADYEIVFLALGLFHLVRRSTRGAGRPNLSYLALLASLAFVCRPTAAFAIIAGGLASVPMATFRKKTYWLYLAAALASLAALVVSLDGAGWIPRYYSPLKLTPKTPLLLGLYGVLLSPSRGLLVWSPFLVLVIAGSLRFFATLVDRRLFRLAVFWTGLHLLAVATKAAWWGGHSYGPRLMSEVMLPALLASCLVWRELDRRRTRIVVAAAYLGLGLCAVAIHSVQGLFHHATLRWNHTPNVDRVPQVLFDWRHPQFLASESSLEERSFEHQRRQLGTYPPGEVLAYDTSGALFRDWYPPEEGWRWSRGRSPEIILRLDETVVGELYLLRLGLGALGRQEVALEVNGTDAGRLELDGHAVRERAFAFASDLLRPGEENRFRFQIPGASSTAEDDRLLGLALYSFALHPLPAGFDGVGFDDEPFFARGFSNAEHGWRWTDGRRAAIDYPLAATANLDTLVLAAGALEPQLVEVRLNGAEAGELRVPGGFATVTRRLTFDPALLRPLRMNRIELSIPRARRTLDDARLLGLAFVRLELHPGTPGIEPGE